MAWQNCPVCNGTGKINEYYSLTPTHVSCPTCNGQRIISEVTGLPPAYTPIELPSDEEIEELSLKIILYNDVKRAWLKIGAKWLRDKILNQNK